MSCENYAATYYHVKPLLQIGGIDARSVQKTPAGVLVVRRGLFFVKRQRRYAAYLQKAYGEYILCRSLCFGERRLVLRICGVSARHGYDYRAKNEIMQGIYLQLDHLQRLRIYRTYSV